MSSAPQGSWFGRNWFWVVPVGCLVPVVVCCGGVTLLGVWGISLMKDTDIYKDALAQAKSDPAVTNALGQPVEAEWLLQVNKFEDQGNTGSADMSIPLKGSKASGNLHATGEKAGGKWTLTNLTLEVQPSGEKINVPVK